MPDPPFSEKPRPPIYTDILQQEGLFMVTWASTYAGAFPALRQIEDHRQPPVSGGD